MTKSSFRKTVEKFSEQGGSSDPNLSPCMRCKTPTAWATLSQYGARCQSCFDAYCAEGSSGGRDGFLQGAPDTAEQRDMRKRLKDSRPIGQSMAARTSADLDASAIAAAKAATARKLRDYAKRNGLSLSDSATLLAGRRNSTAEKASALDEPAWLREGESR